MQWRFGQLFHDDYIMPLSLIQCRFRESSHLPRLFQARHVSHYLFFDDRVKITNPGGIYQATLEQIMSGVQTYRNPGLVNILNKLHYIENFGTGIPRILKAYEGANKQPIFNPSGNFFILTLPNQNYADPVNDPVKIRDEKLGDLELIILQAIQQNPGISTRNLLKLIQEKRPEATLDTLKNNIKRKLHDYIEFRGSQRKGGYFIKERNQ